jgi:hypothetical protein
MSVYGQKKKNNLSESTLVRFYKTNEKLQDNILYRMMRSESAGSLCKGLTIDNVIELKRKRDNNLFQQQI